MIGSDWRVSESGIGLVVSLLAKHVLISSGSSQSLDYMVGGRGWYSNENIFCD